MVQVSQPRSILGCHTIFPSYLCEIWDNSQTQKNNPSSSLYYLINLVNNNCTRCIETSTKHTITCPHSSEFTRTFYKKYRMWVDLSLKVYFCRRTRYWRYNNNNSNSYHRCYYIVKKGILFVLKKVSFSYQTKLQLIVIFIQNCQQFFWHNFPPTQEKSANYTLFSFLKDVLYKSQYRHVVDGITWILLRERKKKQKTIGSSGIV